MSSATRVFNRHHWPNSVKNLWTRSWEVQSKTISSTASVKLQRQLFRSDSEWWANKHAIRSIRADSFALEIMNQCTFACCVIGITTVLYSNSSDKLTRVFSSSWLISLVWVTLQGVGSGGRVSPTQWPYPSPENVWVVRIQTCNVVHILNIEKRKKEHIDRCRFKSIIAWVRWSWWCSRASAHVMEVCLVEFNDVSRHKRLSVWYIANCEL